MDPLSDVLSVVRLSGAMFYDVDVTAPWSAVSPPARDLRHVFPGARHLMAYHVVTDGEAWAVPDKGSPIRLRAGSMIVFPHGDPHAVASDPTLTETSPALANLLPLALRPPYQVRGGGAAGNRAKLICGFFGCDAKPFNPLLTALPPVVIVEAASEDAGDLGVFFKLIVDAVNAGAPGGAATLERLGELMLIEAIRRYMRQVVPSESNWLGSLADPNIGQAIQAVHAEPSKSWTVALLAHQAAMSRTAFAAKFMQLTGVTPMTYVRGWRMQLAASALSDGATVSAAGFLAGYDSEAAFSRAFRRLTGFSPGAWRKSASEDPFRRQPNRAGSF